MAKKVAKKASAARAGAGGPGAVKAARGGARGGAGGGAGGVGRGEAEERAARAGWAFVPLGELLGHDGPRAVLEAALRSGRVHHAWVFSGPEGVGKRACAVGFAALLLDPTTAPTLAGVIEADPQSRVQRLIRAGAHPDLHVVAKELAESSRDAGVRGRKQMTIAREVVQEFLIEPSARTRVMSGESAAGKVFIVDEAHLLGREAQNLLLKTLEEPPAGTVIVLITPSEERLLPTIRSRCQRVAFGPLDDGSMRAWALRARLGEEGLGGLLALAEGSPGRLEALVRTGSAGWLGELEPMLAHADRGEFIVDLGPRMAELINEHAERAVAGRKTASKDAANRAAAHELFAQLAWRYREQLRAGAGGGAGGADARRLRDAAAAIDLIVTAESRLASNVQVAMVADALAAELAGRW